MKLTSLALTATLALISSEFAVAEIVTFSGNGVGPFDGAFRGGTVTATATGPSILPGSTIVIPNSPTFPFGTDQFISIKDDGNDGAAVSFAFAGETFSSSDLIFITNVGAESNVLLRARVGGVDVDADWNTIEAVGDPLVFDDDGSGVNATIMGTDGQLGGLTLRPSSSGFEELVVSWTGNSTGNQGLQFGIVAVPEPNLFGLLAASCVFVAVRRRLKSRRPSRTDRDFKQHPTD